MNCHSASCFYRHASGEVKDPMYRCSASLFVREGSKQSIIFRPNCLAKTRGNNCEILSASTLTICASPITFCVINRRSIFLTQDCFLAKEPKVTKLSYHNKENPLVYVPALFHIFSTFRNSKPIIYNTVTLFPFPLHRGRF